MSLLSHTRDTLDTMLKSKEHFRVHPVYHKFSFWATGLVYQKVGIVTMI